jgi:hypothetical protein
MPSTRTVYHVIPSVNAEQWLVSQENVNFRQEFRTKEDAVSFAKERAREQEPSQVKVHKSDGNLDYESTYGEDPARSPS